MFYLYIIRVKVFLILLGNRQTVYIQLNGYTLPSIGH